jgi:hypothetical protein
MKLSKLVFICIIIISLVSIILSSCEDDQPLKPREPKYHIYVDSIFVQEEILQTEILDITFYITFILSCYKFHSFETSYDSHVLKVKSIGEIQNEIPCSIVTRHEEKILPITGFPTGMSYIEVLQPDGTI